MPYIDVAPTRGPGRLAVKTEIVEDDSNESCSVLPLADGLEKGERLALAGRRCTAKCHISLAVENTSHPESRVLANFHQQ